MILMGGMMAIRRSSFGDAIHWLDGHTMTMTRYLQNYYTPYDWKLVKNFFRENPIQAKHILRDFLKINDAKVNYIINFIINGKSKILIINGGRGSGKTCLAMNLADRIHNHDDKIRIAFVGEDLDEDAFPDWIKIIESAEKIKNAIVIIDEASIKFSSRRSMEDSNVALSQLVAISRHQNLTIIFLTQHLKLMDINAWRMRSAVFYLMGVDSFSNEKSKSDFHKTHLKMRLMMRPREMGECLFDLSEFNRLFTFKFSPPEWWNEKISKAFRDFNPHESIIKKKIEKKKQEQQEKLDFFKQKEEIRAKAYKKQGIKQINETKSEEGKTNPMN